jgi:hypothetical protein
MKKIFKKASQKILTGLILLTVSFTGLATGIKNVATTSSLSSRSGIEISLLVAFLISLIIILSSKTPQPREFKNKKSVY